MKYFLGCLLFSFFTALIAQDGFLKDQKRYPRVRAAIAEKQALVEELLESRGLEIDDFHLLMVAYKDKDLLELHAKKRSGSEYRLIDQYEICARSGVLGPKRRQGDYQVPEGFYHINRFNPASNFHLSVGLNYPNLADRRKSTFEQLGGDIFIHGDCVTIGCLPMTNNHIREIYLYAIHARNNGQDRVPVYVFPYQMTDENMVVYTEKYSDNQGLVDFWANLKIGHDEFFRDKCQVRFKVAKNGDYLFQ